MLTTEWLGSAALASEHQSQKDRDANRISQQEYDDKISRAKTEYLKLWQVI